MSLFHTKITLPDSGLQERDHEDLHELKLYLLACARMGGDLYTMSVTACGTPITGPIRNELVQQLFPARE